MGQLDIFVKRLRATYPKGYVPDFDPNDGGINAEILLLFGITSEKSTIICKYQRIRF